MSAKRPRSRVSNSPQQSPSIVLLETLAESRISILYFARQAKEAKNNVLAKELTAQGQALRSEIARLRRSAIADWAENAKTLVARAAVVQSRLTRLVQDAEKASKKSAVLTRALGLASTLLGLAKKVL